jgi:hypothetical protein
MAILLSDIRFIEAIASLCGEFAFFSALVITAVKVVIECL